MGLKHKTILSACALIMLSATADAAETSAGSSVVIGGQGEILTNAHVVEGCTEINVRFASGSPETARLVARDEANDLAVIRATGRDIPAPSIARFRDSAPVRVGDVVVALGYPLSGLLTSNANLPIGNLCPIVEATPTQQAAGIDDNPSTTYGGGGEGVGGSFLDFGTEYWPPGWDI